MISCLKTPTFKNELLLLFVVVKNNIKYLFFKLCLVFFYENVLKMNFMLNLKCVLVVSTHFYLSRFFCTKIPRSPAFSKRLSRFLVK